MSAKRRHHRPLLVLALIALLPVEIRAERASPTEAELVCRNWLACVVHQTGSWASEPRPHILDRTELVASDGDLLAYCFAVSPRGHVLVPVLKELPPVKAYSQTSGLDVGAARGFVQLVRERLTLLLDRYREAYGSLEAVQPTEGEVLFDRAHRRTWERLLASPADMDASLRAGEWPSFMDAGPLLTTMWHQSEPFNGFCPDGDGGRCLVGCVATAAAQIMNYHEWPEAGFGEHSYEWRGDHSCGGSTPGDTLSAIFRDSYDWAGMPEVRAGVGPSGGGRARNEAVAELCYEVGVAVEMNYGHCASGAGTITRQLTAYFRYDDSIAWRSGRDYSSDEWFALIQEEIDESRPIFYTYPFHALVCDGWRVVGDEKQIHLNYGEGGPLEAWYAMDEIFGHPFDHEVEDMVVNIFPDSAIILTADGSGDHPTIQDAIGAAADGDVIKLQDGAYSGPGNRDIDFAGKALTLRSQSRDPTACVIDAGGSESDPHRGVVFDSAEPPSAVLEDVWLTGAWTAGVGGSVYCVDASPTVKDCVIEGNTALLGGGGVFSRSSRPAARGPTIAGSTVYGNAGGGILVKDCEVVIENTLIVGNTGGAAVSCLGAGDPALTCCDVYGNPEGDWVGCIESQLGSNGNMSVDPVFCAPWDGVLTLSAVSCCLAENNACRVQVGALGAGCEDLVVYPDGSGYFPTIQAAIDSLPDDRPSPYGNSIVLADGVFTGPGNWDIDCSKGVRIQSASGDATSCIVDCSGGGRERHRGFWFHDVEGGRCVVDSISIVTAGAPSGDGAAIRCGDNTVVWIRGCRLRGNEAVRGGGVSVGAGSVVTLIGCELSANSASRGGALSAADSSIVRLSRSTLADNAAPDGSGIYLSDATLQVSASVVAFGVGGEAVWSQGDSLDFYCTDIYGNAGGDWVGGLEGFLGVDGNTSADPLFCDPAAGDYTIAEDSPCLDESVCVPAWADYIGVYGVGCTSPDGDGPEVPLGGLYLSQNYPNPFSPVTDFKLVLPASGRVRLVIYDLGGRVVATPLDEDRPSGVSTARWDGRNDRGLQVAAGVYFAKLEQDGLEDVRKIVIVK